jgi:hypothetical protein
VLLRSLRCLTLLACALGVGSLWGAQRESGPPAASSKPEAPARPQESNVPFVSTPAEESSAARDPEEQRAIERLKKDGGFVRGTADPGFHIFITGKTDRDSLKQLAAIPHLRWLYLSGDWITDDCLPQLRRLAPLRFLGLATPNVGDQGIQEIAGLSHLELLTLRGLKVTDDGLAPLARLSELSSLEITECPHVHGARLRDLAAMPKLTEVFLEDNALDEKELSQLRGCAALYRLVISDGHLTDAALPSLRGLSPSVKSIQLHNTRHSAWS